MSAALEEAKQRFLALAEGTVGSGALDALRADGRAAFADQGLPTTKWEEWRYTSLAGLAGVTWTDASPGGTFERAALEEVAAPLFACALEVFVDGFHHAELDGAQSSDAVKVLADSEPFAGLGSLAAAKEHPFVALNGALSRDGAGVTIRGTEARAVHLVFAESAQDVASHPRVWIEAEPGSRGTVIVDHVSMGDAAHFANAVIEIQVAENAEIDVVVIQRPNDASYHVGHIAAQLERDARLRTHVLTLGGAFVRNDLQVTLAGQGAEAVMNGLYLGGGKQLVDNHTWVDHAVPHCSSHELYKGVLGDDSKGVFRGRVLVRPDAQKTDATQSNPNLLLADGAEIDTKPQLEIYADDVKCSHGSAIGRLDPDALFFLRSRGIGKEDARALLTRGFAAEVLQQLPEPALSEAMAALFETRFDSLGQRG